jgi:tetratricopeptide (TPR) repeat protein
MRLLLALSLFVLTFGYAGAAHAESSRWTKVRRPDLYKEEKVALEAERELLRMAPRRQRPSIDDALTPPTAYAMKARALLLQAGAERSESAHLRLLLGRAEHALHHFEAAGLLFESIVKDPSVPVPFRADAWGDLAIVYARLKRVDQEIEAEESAIALEPLTANRALTIANQAEAYMGKGDVARAIAGYRGALENLSSFELLRVAPTTLFSLGVALDRSGDLEGGFDAIVRARGYDPRDGFLNHDSWFFSSAWDEEWYEALGHWVIARRHDDGEVRLGAYERAVVAWKEYIARAPATDPYVALARVRLKLCEQEFEALSKKAQSPTPIAAPRTGPPKRRKF